MKFIILILLVLAGPALLPAQATLRAEGPYAMHINDAYLVADSTNLLFRNSMQNNLARLKMTGATNPTLQGGGNTFGQLEIAKTANTKVVMPQTIDAIFLEDGLVFLSMDNHLELNFANVNLLPSAQITGYNDRSYCITNGGGYLRKYQLGVIPFEYPVGNDALTYNPMILTEHQSPDNYGVRCLPNVLDQGGTGAVITTGVVDASWEVVEDVPGEMELNMEVYWEGGQELPGFGRNHCGIAWWEGSTWDLTVPYVGMAGGADPYQRARTMLVEPGYFAVGGEALAEPGGAVDVKVLLEGPYAGSGDQQDDLRSAGVIPNQEPYTALGFTQAGFGGGQSVDPDVFNTTGMDAIVDWLLIEVYDTGDPAQLLATAPALLQKDGDVVDMDGESILSIPGLPEGNYILAVRHRNHLAVQMNSAVFLSSAPTLIDLMTDPSVLVGGTNAVADFGDGFYGLVSGDFDGNGQVQNTDAAGLIQLLGGSGYEQGDVDLNSQIQNIDLQLKLTPNLGRGQQF